MNHRTILRMKKNIRSIVEKEYNLEDQTKRFIEIFEGYRS